MSDDHSYSLGCVIGRNHSEPMSKNAAVCTRLENISCLGLEDLLKSPVSVFEKIFLGDTS